MSASDSLRSGNTFFVYDLPVTSSLVNPVEFSNVPLQAVFIGPESDIDQVLLFTADPANPVTAVRRLVSTKGPLVGLLPCYPNNQGLTNNNISVDVQNLTHQRKWFGNLGITAPITSATFANFFTGSPGAAGGAVKLQLIGYFQPPPIGINIERQKHYWANTVGLSGAPASVRRFPYYGRQRMSVTFNTPVYPIAANIVMEIRGWSFDSADASPNGRAGYEVLSTITLTTNPDQETFSMEGKYFDAIEIYKTSGDVNDVVGIRYEASDT